VLLQAQAQTEAIVIITILNAKLVTRLLAIFTHTLLKGVGEKLRNRLSFLVIAAPGGI
jgi:hypothetical protein